MNTVQCEICKAAPSIGMIDEDDSPDKIHVCAGCARTAYERRIRLLSWDIADLQQKIAHLPSPTEAT